MINKNVVLMEEIPYQELNKIGLTKKDLLSFPKEVLEPLVTGKVTPLLVSTIQKSNGEYVDIPLKLQLLKDKNGDVNVIIYPMRKDIFNDNNLSQLEIDKLQKGEVLRKEIRENGMRIQRYFQLDIETKSIIKKDAADLRISDRLQEVEKLGSIELGLNQKRAIVEGKPVELQLNETVVTVGVDLKQPIGFKHLQGDIQDWEQAKLVEYDRLTPGFMGYVKTDANRWEYQQIVDLSNKSSETLTKTMKNSL